MSEDRFDAPDDVAMAGFPPEHCRVVASRVNGDYAYVLLNTGPSEQPYLYGIHCRRENGTWLQKGSSNDPGWEQTDDDPETGTLAFWDHAPAGADMVGTQFDGRTFEGPVMDRIYLLVWWGVAEPQNWPCVQAFRMAGVWVDYGGLQGR